MVCKYIIDGVKFKSHIAEKIGVSPTMVNNYIDNIREEMERVFKDD